MDIRYPIIRPFCPCGTRIGAIQKEFEILTAQVGPMLALERLKITNMCCRNAMLDPPHYLINDACYGRIQDETGLYSGTITYELSRTMYAEAPTITPIVTLPTLPPLPV